MFLTEKSELKVFSYKFQTEITLIIVDKERQQTFLKYLYNPQQFPHISEGFGIRKLQRRVTIIESSVFLVMN